MQNPYQRRRPRAAQAARAARLRPPALAGRRFGATRARMQRPACGVRRRPECGRMGEIVHGCNVTAGTARMRGGDARADRSASTAAGQGRVFPDRTVSALMGGALRQHDQGRRSIRQVKQAS
ncbi:hypothetical protein [Burkholderia stagnalis]|uniref:hypothetical protein n=1 Tax=Burkholderia stagnalis TaxID=1503054 RepID=UPI0012D9CA88|nr:hypothetical protein [Burkholderia stagnalis]